MQMNEITGDILATKPASEASRQGYDKIFNKEYPIIEDRPKKQILLLNQAKCNICNEVITSKHTHDYVSCYCGNLAVDGGTSYTKRNFTTPDYTELSVYADEDDILTIRDYFSWGSYGPKGDQPKHYILLRDMTSEHIHAILETQYHIKGTQTEKMFLRELDYREDNDL